MDVEVFRRIVLANELGGDQSLAYRFSDPDGVRTGKSGYSFGVCQLDINNNPSAILCLRECRFTTDEISALKAQTMSVSRLCSKLEEHADIVDTWDNRQLLECIEHPLKVCARSGVMLSGPGGYHLADYHNQFYLSPGGKMDMFLRGLGRQVIPEDILDFKLSIRWGLKRPDDVRRRYNNIVSILEGGA